MPEQPTRQGLVVDALFGFAVFAVVAIAVGADVSGEGDQALGYVMAFLLGGLMLLRRPAPVLVLLATCVLVIGNYVIELPTIGLAIPVAGALYSAAEAGRTRWAAGGSIALLLVSTLARLGQGQDIAYLLGYELASTVAVMGAAIALGDGARQRREGARQRERIAALDTQARDAEAAERSARERTGIARDLHDAVGHHLSVVSLHAAVATEALEEDEADLPTAREELAHVRQASREGLRDLRATVRALREPGAEVEPIAGLAHLESLVGSVRDAGLTVEVSGSAGEGLPGLVDATAYRVIQEALTNTLRHARARRARVLLERDGEEFVVTVTDDGRTVDVPVREGSGLTGMRERVRMAGGAVEFGSVPAGGFRVSARLPVGGGV